MRQQSGSRGHWADRLIGSRWFGLILYETVALVLATGLVWARDDPKQEAKSRYSTGQSHYNLNEFQEALQDFKEAYRLYPDPAFLFNAAQCERQLGHQEEAIQFYRSYLRNAPKAPNRQEVEHRIEELQAALEARKNAAPTATAPPASPPEPATGPPPGTPPVSPAAVGLPADAKPAEPAPAVLPAVANPEVAGAVLPAASAPAETRPDLASTPSSSPTHDGSAFYQRWWFWTGVAAVAAGIGVGTYVLTSGNSSQAPSSQLGTKNVF